MKKFYIEMNEERILEIRNLFCLLYCIVSDQNLLTSIVECYHMFNEINRKIK